MPHDLFQFTTAAENDGGPSSTRPKRQKKTVGLTEFGPANSHLHFIEGS